MCSPTAVPQLPSQRPRQIWQGCRTGDHLHSPPKHCLIGSQPHHAAGAVLCVSPLTGGHNAAEPGSQGIFLIEVILLGHLHQIGCQAVEADALLGVVGDHILGADQDGSLAHGICFTALPLRSGIRAPPFLLEFLKDAISDSRLQFFSCGQFQSISPLRFAPIRLFCLQPILCSQIAVRGLSKGFLAWIPAAMPYTHMRS